MAVVRAAAGAVSLGRCTPEWTERWETSRMRSRERRGGAEIGEDETEAGAGAEIGAGDPEAGAGARREVEDTEASVRTKVWISC